MREVRAGIAPEERVRLSAEVERRLLGLPEVGGAEGILVFYAFGTEILTSGLIRSLADQGHRVFLPVLDGAAMHAAAYRPGDPLAPTSYGAREPARRSLVPPRDVDLVVAPGLAFDRAGYRLGYGGGYYDRFLAGARPDAGRVGIGFHQQLVDAVPHGPGDVPLTVVVTDREVVACPG